MSLMSDQRCNVKELRRELHHPKAAKVVAEPPNERKTIPLSYPYETGSAVQRHKIASK